MSISVAFFEHFLPIFIHLKIQTQSPSTEKVKITILNIKAALTYKGRKLGIRPTKHKVKAILIPIFFALHISESAFSQLFRFCEFSDFPSSGSKKWNQCLFLLGFPKLVERRAVP